MTSNVFKINGANNTEQKKKNAKHGVLVEKS